MIRVLYSTPEIAPFAGDGPESALARCLAAGLVRAGAWVTVAAPWTEPAAPSRLARRLSPAATSRGPVTVYEGPLPGGGGEVLLVEIGDPTAVVEAALSLARPDVVHLALGDDALAAALAARGIPAVRDEELELAAGVDTARWPRPADATAGKPAAKRRAQRALGLPPVATAPLFVAELTPSHPIDPLLWSGELESLLAAAGAQLVVVHAGDGDGPAPRSRRATTVTGADDERRRELLWAADFAILAHEPTRGPSNLHAARYGAVPIAPREAPYAGTLVELDLTTATGSGIFYAPDPERLVAAARRALRAYAHPHFPAVARGAARLDLGWLRPARAALGAYARAAAGQKMDSVGS